jgi:hypothetical protein
MHRALLPLMLIPILGSAAVAQASIDIRTPSAQRTVPLAQIRRITFTSVPATSTASMIIRYADFDVDTIRLRDITEIRFADDGAFSTMTTVLGTGASFVVDVAEIALLEFPAIPSTVPVDAQISNGVRVYPNPFVNGVTVEFPLAARSDVALEIVDARGGVVRALGTSTLDGGMHSIAWDGADAGGSRVAPGVYYFVARTAGTVLVHALVNIR